MERNQVSNEIVVLKKTFYDPIFVNHPGDGITNCIAFENELIASYSSFITQQAAEDNIQALFNTEVQILNREKVHDLVKKQIKRYGFLSQI